MGDACAELRNQLDVSYPVHNGIVQNWDDMGHVWDHAFFNELKVHSNQNTVGFHLFILFILLIKMFTYIACIGRSNCCCLYFAID